MCAIKSFTKSLDFVSFHMFEEFIKSSYLRDPLSVLEYFPEWGRQVTIVFPIALVEFL